MPCGRSDYDSIHFTASSRLRRVTIKVAGVLGITATKLHYSSADLAEKYLLTCGLKSCIFSHSWNSLLVTSPVREPQSSPNTITLRGRVFIAHVRQAIDNKAT